MRTVLEFLEGFHKKLSSDIVDYLSRHLKRLPLKKGQVLLKKGQICNCIYFIEEGFLGCFFNKGKRAIYDWFMLKNEVVVSVSSFFKQTESDETIIAIEDTVLFYITKEELDEMFEIFPDFRTIGLKVMTYYYCHFFEFLKSVLRNEPEALYKELLQRNPDLVSRIGSRALSSLMGISKSTLNNKIKDTGKPKPTVKKRAKKKK